MMGSLRDALLRAEGFSFDEGDLAVATFFSSDALTRVGDKVFAEDSDLDAYLKRHPDILVVGDPLLARLPRLRRGVWSKRRIPLYRARCSATSKRVEKGVAG